MPDGKFLYFGRDGWEPYRDVMGAMYSGSVCSAAEFASMFPEVPDPRYVADEMWASESDMALLRSRAVISSFSLR